MKNKNLRAIAKNKKGIDYYAPTVSIIGLFILGFILFSLASRDYKLTSGLSIGSEQFNIMKAYSNAEKNLLFVDSAAKLALEQAIYPYGKNGLYAAATSCGQRDGYNYWTKDTAHPKDACQKKTAQPCFPDEKIMKETLLGFFEPLFRDIADKFNQKSSLDIPLNYKPFEFSQAAKGTEVKGTANEPLTIQTANIKYSIKPSFRETVGINAISEGKAIVENAQKLVRLNKKQAETRLNEFNAANPSLKWSLAGYLTPGAACSHVLGPCHYACNCQDISVGCGDDKGGSCSGTVCETCIGSMVETVSYNDVYATFSVSNGKSFYVSDPPSSQSQSQSQSQPKLKAMNYNFGLNWLEETSRTTVCKP